VKKIKEIISVLAAIVTITGIMKWAWVKGLLENIWEHKLIATSIIVIIAIIAVIIKKRSSICKIFKWLLDKCFQLIRKITGISKLIEKYELEIKREFEAHKKELQDKIEENDEGKRLYLFLKKIYPNSSSANVQIIIKSDTYKKTETEYEKHDFNTMYNKIDTYHENEFEIVALGYRRSIPYEEVYCWKLDKRESGKCNPKIHLHLYSDIVLDEGKLVLEDVKSKYTKQANITAQGRP
jgi:hypothetical protein